MAWAEMADFECLQRYLPGLTTEDLQQLFNLWGSQTEEASLGVALLQSQWLQPIWKESLPDSLHLPQETPLKPIRQSFGQWLLQGKELYFVLWSATPRVALLGSFKFLLSPLRMLQRQIHLFFIFFYYIRKGNNKDKKIRLKN